MNEPAFRIPFVVRSYELDSLGHLNNAVYFSWMEDAPFAFLADHGLPFAEFARQRWYPILAHAEVDFRREVLSGDTIVVEGWAQRYGRTSMELGYRFVRESGEAFDPAQGIDVVAEGRRVWVFVHLDDGKMEVPEIIRRAFGDARESADAP